MFLKNAENNYRNESRFLSCALSIKVPTKSLIISYKLNQKLLKIKKKRKLIKALVKL